MAKIPSDSNEAGKFTAFFEQVAERQQQKNSKGGYQDAEDKFKYRGGNGGTGQQGFGIGMTQEQLVEAINKKLGQQQGQGEGQQGESQGEQQQGKETNPEDKKELGSLLQQLMKQMQQMADKAEKQIESATQNSNQSQAAASSAAQRELEKKAKDVFSKIKEEAIEAAKEVVSPKFEITLPDMKKIETDDGDIIHPEFERAIKILNTLDILWLCGPAGCGKTHLAGQLAKYLNLPYYALSCTAGMSESWFIGRRDLSGGYLTPEFLNKVENGGLTLLDEFDAGDPNTNLIINSLLSNGYLSIPMRVEKPIAIRHKDHKVVIATNTWGFGPDGMYTGREGLDASTRDRAVIAKIGMDYSTRVEAGFIKPTRMEHDKDNSWVPAQNPTNIADAFYTIRGNIKQHNLRRVMSTRSFEQAAKLNAVGFSGAEILRIYFADWTETERNKALVGISWS